MCLPDRTWSRYKKNEVGKQSSYSVNADGSIFWRVPKPHSAFRQRAIGDQK
jgi:hypothetical protein